MKAKTENTAVSSGGGIFRKIFNTKIDAIGLAVFRVAYITVLFCDICQLFRFRGIIYDKVPFLVTGEINVTFLFGFWFIILAMLFLGLFTRTAAIINYIFGVIVFGSATNFEYHVFYAYLGINFLLIFLPVSRVFSIDRLIQKVKYTNIGRPYRPDRTVLEINYLIPVFVAIALVYFDSIFYKYSARMWTDGLGMWTPSSLPMMIWNDTSAILNQEWLVRSLGYIVLAFETVFIFLFWFRKFRVPFALLGIFFHLGILIAYPIPWFALTAVVVYLLLLPPSFWLRIGNVFKSKSPSFKFYYDAECPLCNKVVVIIRHFDIFNKIECVTVQGYAATEKALEGISELDLLINIHGVDKRGRVSVGYDAYVTLMRHMIWTYPAGLLLAVPGISTVGKKIYRYVAGNRLTERCTSENCMMPELSLPMDENEDLLIEGWNRLAITKNFWKWLLILFTILQLHLICISPTVQRFIGGTTIGNALQTSNRIMTIPLKKFLGIGPHPVFMYNIHFEGYNHIFKIVCKNNGKIVPLLDNNGMVRNSYANGALWVNYTFRVNSPKLYLGEYEQGVVPYLRQFEKENNLANGTYEIYVKEIQTTDHWQKDFLHQQMRKPWLPAGECQLTATSANFTWNPQMRAMLANKRK